MAHFVRVKLAGPNGTDRYINLDKVIEIEAYGPNGCALQLEGQRDRRLSITPEELLSLPKLEAF